MAMFCTFGSNNWETVEDRWVHAARGLASTELSFHSCNVLRGCHRGVPRGNKNVVKKEVFGLTHWPKHRITRKLLKIDRYMPQGVWQALNCLSIHATYCVIIAGGVSMVNKNVGCGTWKRQFFAIPGLFVPLHFRSQERKDHRENFRSMEHSLLGTFAPVELSLLKSEGSKNFRSVEQFHRSERSKNFRSYETVVSWERIFQELSLHVS